MGTRIPTNSDRPVPYKKKDTVQSQFDHIDGSKEYKERILYFIKNLLIQYKEKTQKETEKFDKEFIRNFRDDFKKLITDYIDNFGSNIDIEGIIKQVFDNEQYIDNVSKEIKGILTSLFKERGFIQNNEDNLKFDSDLDSSINKLFDSTNISDQQIDTFSNKVLNQLDGFKSSLSEQMEKNTDKLINDFRDNILKNSKKNKDDKKDQNSKTRTSRKNPFKIRLDPYTKLFGDKIVKKMIGFIAFSSYKRMFMAIGKLFNTLWKFASKALDLSIKMISGIMSFTFGLVVNGLINPLYKMVAAPVGLIIKFTGTIISTLTGLLSKLVSGKAMQMMLLTPTGMYALGFFLGFLWSKIEKALGITGNGNDNPEDDILKKIEKKIKKLNDAILGVYNNIKKQWEGSELRKKILSGKNKITDIFNDIKKNGLYEGLRNINDTTRMIFDVVIDPLRTIGEFCWKHKKSILSLISVAGIGASIASNYNALRVIFQLVGIPFKAFRNVGLFPALASALIAYGGAKVTEAFLEGCFGSKTKSGLNYIDDRIRNAYELKGFRHERGSEFTQKEKLSDAEKIIDEELQTVERLKKDIGYVATITDNGNDVNEEDLEHIKDLAKEIFDSNFYTEPNKTSYTEFYSPNTTPQKKLELLTKVLSNRIENVIGLQNTLNVGSNEQVQSVLNRIVKTENQGKKYINLFELDKQGFIPEMVTLNDNKSGQNNWANYGITEQFIKNNGVQTGGQVWSVSGGASYSTPTMYDYTIYDKPRIYSQEIAKKLGESDKYKKYSEYERYRKAQRYVSAYGITGVADVYKKLISGNDVEKILDEIEEYDIQQQKIEQENKAKQQQDIDKIKKDTKETKEKTEVLNQENSSMEDILGE